MGWLTTALRSAAAKLAPGAAPSATPPPQVEPQPAPAAPNQYAQGIDQIRRTATWLIGALAALGAVLIAGSQLSSIGKLTVTDNAARLAVASIAAVTAIGAVVYAIYRLSTVLSPVTASLKTLRDAEADQSSTLVQMVKSDSGLTAGRGTIALLLTDYEAERQAGYAAHAQQRAARTELDAATTEEAKAAAALKQAAADRDEQRSDAETAILRRAVVTLTQLHGYLSVVRKFEQERSKVLVAAVVGAIAILIFAWAANPQTTTAPAATALPAVPVPATLYLTSAGVAELTPILGSGCATAAHDTGTPAIALASTTSGVDMLITTAGPCQHLVRISLETRLGHLVATTPATSTPAPTTTSP